MSWSSKTILCLVELLLYATIAPITVYTLSKHRQPSILAHVYLFGFFGLRIAADGMIISSRNAASPNTTATILNSIGLSPLLLATAGFIGEARSYLSNIRQSRNGKNVGILIEATLHTFVVAGVAILATGNSNAAKATSQQETDQARTLAKAGAVLLLISWLIVCIWAVNIFRHTKEDARNGQRLPRLLATKILVSLPFLGIRVAYSMVYTYDHSPNLSPATATFVVYFFLLFLSQLICTIILVLALIVTRNIRQTQEQDHVFRSDHTWNQESGKTTG